MKNTARANGTQPAPPPPRDLSPLWAEARRQGRLQTRDAIHDYQAMEERQRTVDRELVRLDALISRPRGDEDEDLRNLDYFVSRLDMLGNLDRMAATKMMLSAILLWQNEVGLDSHLHDVEKGHWHNTGVAYEDKVYLAIQTADVDEVAEIGPRDGHGEMMTLRVMDRSRLINVDMKEDN